MALANVGDWIKIDEELNVPVNPAQVEEIVMGWIGDIDEAITPAPHTGPKVRIGVGFKRNGKTYIFSDNQYSVVEP